MYYWYHNHECEARKNESCVRRLDELDALVSGANDEAEATGIVVALL